MAQGALPGFRDFYPELLAERAYIFGVWRDVARRFAFAEYDGPPLEPLELYTKKSGDEIVGQLYNFVDKGERQVALRPEMTPTLARMVAARANALRKPVRWFSIPQLFRYERKQRGRLREHFQLNVDIIGEADVTADAELLAVAIEIMRELGLTSADVHARVSDRRLLRAILLAIGIDETNLEATFSIIDKIERQPREVTSEKLAGAGVSATSIEALFGLMTGASRKELRERFGNAADVGPRLDDFDRYFARLEQLGVSDFVSLDLSIVRGLAYYTGIVFELFDAKGELRAICGGGRYDNLLQSLGGVDLPALGFGMGDVVIAELLREHGHLEEHATVPQPDFWVAPSTEAELPAVVPVVTALRRAGASVEYALRDQSVSKQKKASHSAGATYFVTLIPDFAASHRVEIEPFAETASPTLAELLGAKSPTVEQLVSVVRANPQILQSTL